MIWSRVLIQAWMIWLADASAAFTTLVSSSGMFSEANVGSAGYAGATGGPSAGGSSPASRSASSSSRERSLVSMSAAFASAAWTRRSAMLSMASRSTSIRSTESRSYPKRVLLILGLRSPIGKPPSDSLGCARHIGVGPGPVERSATRVCAF